MLRTVEVVKDHFSVCDRRPWTTSLKSMSRFIVPANSWTTRNHAPVLGVDMFAHRKVRRHVEFCSVLEVVSL